MFPCPRTNMPPNQTHVRVIPRRNGGNDTVGDVFHAGSLVTKHESGGADRRSQPQFSRVTQRTNLFRGGQYFSQISIDHRFARIFGTDATNRTGVLDNVFLDRPQYQSSLTKGRLGPRKLSFLRQLTSGVDLCRRHGDDFTQMFIRGGVVALDKVGTVRMNQRWTTT